MAADPEWLEDLFEPFGKVRLKRMFSGYGIYHGDYCIALAINPGLCFRVDETTRAAFEAIGATPFEYTKQGKTVTVKAWWRVPEALVDEQDEIVRLARLSLDVARRLPPKKPRRARTDTGKPKRGPIKNPV